MATKWICSGGGPLLCASPTAIRKWRGIQGSSIEQLKSDYDRACEQTDYISAIACGSSQVLVLGDEPLQSAFIQHSTGLIVIRWVSCASTEFAERAILQLPAELPEIEESIQFKLGEDGIEMLDSACDGANSMESLSANASPGKFTISTERYKFDGLFEFLVHRFNPDLPLATLRREMDSWGSGGIGPEAAEPLRK